MNRFPLVVLGFSTAIASAQTTLPPYSDRSLPAATRAHDLVSRMTLEEKTSQLEDWAPAIPRLGIPDYQTWSEALHGVANAGYATVFPQAIGMAATWDVDMVRRMGETIATEGRAKFNQAQGEGNHRIFYGLTFWSPNINIFRDPRWGRGQETYGEDPYLTGQMGVAFINGVQGDDPEHPKAVATSKHFAVHSGPESTRHVANVDVSPRDLEDTYLPAFRTTVIDGKVKSVMCAYNAINGDAACANPMLLKEHLRDAWHFKGFVVSDCGAIVDVTSGHHNAPDIMRAAAVSLKAGTDLSCSIWAPGFNTLAKAVSEGLVSEAQVNQAAERLYTARMELGMFDAQGENANDRISLSKNDLEQHDKLALEAANKSLVLLKNNGVLPLSSAVKRIAVIGPTADLLTALEGNYNGQPLRPSTPLDGIIKQFPGSTVNYAQGATLAKGFTVPVPRTVFRQGLLAEYFATPDWTGRTIAHRMEPTIQHDWRDAYPVPEVQTHDYSVRWTGKLRVPATGKYTFVVEGGSNFPYSPQEKYRFALDGKIVGEGSLTESKGPLAHVAGTSPTAPPMMEAAKPATINLDLADNRDYEVTLSYSHSGSDQGGGITLRWDAPAEGQLDEAERVAEKADVVLAFVGLSPQLEGEEMPLKIEGFEGGDRTSIELPASQRALLVRLAKAKKPVVVVCLSGSALALNWAKEHAEAILQAWYPGEQGGAAIAQTLAGINNPAGRLPVTFYASTEELPPFTDYSMKNRTYRYFTGKTLWDFGYGLSYSSFNYSSLKAPHEIEAGKPLVVSASVTNASERAGEEVVEVYVRTPRPDGPNKALTGFQRVRLAPHETRLVTFTLDPRSISSVDADGSRNISGGLYHISVGGRSPGEDGLLLQGDVEVRGTMTLPR